MSALPKSWTIVPFEQVATYASGRTPARAKSAYWNGEGCQFPWVAISDMEPYGTIASTAETISELAFLEAFRGRLVPAGTLLMSFKLTIGRVATLGVPACHNEASISIYPKEHVDQRYLGYFLSQVDYSDHQDRQIKGNTLNQAKIDRIPIALPPLQEQRTIARVLDRIREGVETEASADRTASELRRSTMRELFSRGLRGEAQKETEIGLLPESWSAVPFEAALTIAQGQVDPKVEPYASLLNIGPENVEPNTGRLLICQTAKDLGLISGKYHFRAGDIIYSKIRPYLNKVVMPTFEGVCSSDMYPLRAATGFESRFLFHYLLSEFFLRQAVPHQLRTGIPRINHAQLADTAFPKPPFADQRAIIEILDAIDSKIDLHHRKRAVLEELFKSLLHKLMTGEIRVDQLNLAALDAAQRQEVIP